MHGVATTHVGSVIVGADGLERAGDGVVGNVGATEVPLGSMRTDLSVEEAGTVVDPPKRREAVLGHWCQEKGGV